MWCWDKIGKDEVFKGRKIFLLFFLQNEKASERSVDRE